MTQAWFLGATAAVEQDGTAARSTLTYVDDTTPPMLNDAPEWNETATDNTPEVAGLDTKVAIGRTNPEEKSPAPVQGSVYRDLSHADYNRVVDDQVSTSGTAAGREAAGAWGHGTMQYTESMQPVIRDGGALGNSVFLRESRPVQDGMSAVMTPDQQDPEWAALAQSMAVRHSRNAFNATVLAQDPWRNA